jgi:ABC-type methionine transport system ATPase subunit
MPRRRVKFTFPQETITKPVIYELGQRFRVITNIRKADVTETQGWVLLELEGEEDEIDRSLQWALEAGVDVGPVEGDVIAG